MNKTHTATFMGTINKKRYEYGTGRDPFEWSSYSPKFVRKYFEQDHEIIYSDQFYDPPMSVGDKVHLESIDKNVLVKEVVRDNEGGYIYYTNYIIKEIEDGQTIETLNTANIEFWEEEKAKLERLEKVKYNTSPFDPKCNDKKKRYKFWN